MDSRDAAYICCTRSRPYIEINLLTPSLSPVSTIPPLRELAPHPRVCASSTATWAPRLASVRAADKPVNPAPITATSTRSGKLGAGSGFGISTVVNQKLCSRGAICCLINQRRVTGFTLLTRDLEHRSLVNRSSLRKARQIQQRRIDQGAIPGENQVGQNLSCCRRVHYSVSAEAIRQKKTRHLGNGAQDRMMIRRHFVKSRPCAFRIDGDVLEDGHAVRRPRQDLFDEGWFEFQLVAGGFLGIIPCHQK